MSSITSVILICARALLPQDCTVDSATDMLEGLDANTPIECLMSSQALIVQSALLRPAKCSRPLSESGLLAEPRFCQSAAPSNARP